MKRFYHRLNFSLLAILFILVPARALAHGGEEHSVSTSVYSTIVITDLVLFISGFLIIYRLIKGKWIGKWAWVFIASLLVSYLYIFLVGDPLDLLG